MNKNHSFFTRVTAMLLALVCVLGLLPATALAAPPDTVKLEDCTYNGVQYDSPALGTCRLQQMRFDCGGKAPWASARKKARAWAIPWRDTLGAIPNPLPTPP